MLFRSNPITSLSVIAASGSFIAGSTFSLYGIGAAKASGGTITYDGKYTYHTFTSSSSFTPLEKIKNAFDESNCKWLFHGFTHTTDGIETHRDCVPEWADMLLEGNNLLGSPSCVAFLNDSKLYLDRSLKLLVDTEFYHRMRMEHGLPHIIPDILIANREHENRTSASGIDYDMVLQGTDGRKWLVNSQEINYLHQKHADFYELRTYPDET